MNQIQHTDVYRSKRFRLDMCSFTILYLVIIYPLIPTSVSMKAVAWMAVPFAVVILSRFSSGRGAMADRKMLPHMIIPGLAFLSGGTTAISYACKIGITILTISLLRGNIEKNYQLFLKAVRINGLVVLYTMIFEYFFRNVAITLYSPIWYIYLHGNDELILQSTINASNGAIYGIIPSASYAVNALTFALGTYLIDVSKRKNKIMTFLLYAGIFLTSKRSYMVFVTITLFLIFFVIGERRNAKRRFFYGILIIVLALGIWFIIEPYVTYSPTGLGKLLATIKYFNDPVYIKQYYIRAERDVLGEYALGLFKSNWITGVGWGNFSKIYLADTGIWRLDAHTTYLQVLCESGLFAAIIIFSILGRELIYSIRWLKKDREQFIFFAYVIIFCMLIGFTAFIFDLTQFYVTFFLCVYFMQNMRRREFVKLDKEVFSKLDYKYEVEELEY